MQLTSVRLGQLDFMQSSLSWTKASQSALVSLVRRPSFVLKPVAWAAEASENAPHLWLPSCVESSLVLFLQTLAAGEPRRNEAATSADTVARCAYSDCEAAICSSTRVPVGSQERHLRLEEQMREAEAEAEELRQQLNAAQVGLA